VLSSRMKKQSKFSTRGSDVVTDELAAVLSKGATFEFKPLFDVIHANLRIRNAASGGEEMLRLRAYEKLQNLVQRGVVTKAEKRYQGVASSLNAFIAENSEIKAKLAAHKRERVLASSAIASE
jgi:hypothetical protein